MTMNACDIKGLVFLCLVMGVSAEIIEVADPSSCLENYYSISGINDTAIIKWYGTPVEIIRRFRKTECEIKFSVPWKHEACVQVKSFQLGSCSSKVYFGIKDSSFRSDDATILVSYDCNNQLQPTTGNETAWCSGFSNMVFQLSTGTDNTPDYFELHIIVRKEIPDENEESDNDNANTVTIGGPIAAIAIVVTVVLICVGIVVFMKKCAKAKGYGGRPGRGGVVQYKPPNLDSAVIIPPSQQPLMQSANTSHGYQPVATQPDFTATPQQGFNPQGQMYQPTQPGYQNQPPGFNHQGQPGYVPQGQTGFNPQGQPGFNPQGQPSFNPQGQPGFNPQGQLGFNPQGQPGFNPQGQQGFNPQGQSTQEGLSLPEKVPI